MTDTPFYSANSYFKKIFGKKVYKISLNGGMTCPNRDGKLGYRGCIFCSEGGSGDFAQEAFLPISEQITKGIELVSQKFAGDAFIAYFQAFTNTYAPVDYLEKIFYEAICDPRIAGLSIATRPDCLSPEIISLLSRLAAIKPLWVELGLQTVNENTAEYIRRGYKLSVFDEAVNRLHEADINVIAHMIIGLPGEGHDDYMNTSRHIADLNISGIKLQLLHVLKNTDLAADYQAGKFRTLSREEYVRTVVDIIETLPPSMVIHRITGDGPRSLLISPQWSTDKKNILNLINREFKNRDT